MVKTKKFIIVLMLFFCFFILVGSVSAANLRVNDKTSYEDITEWLNTAKNGDSLIFTRSNYNLTDTIIIDKSIHVRSTKNTKIHFDKNKTMFIVAVNGVKFSKLTLNHYGHGNIKQNSKGREVSRNVFAVVSASQDSFKRINFNKVTINANNSFVSGIDIPLWNGSISNSKINIKGLWGHGITADQWMGNAVKTQVTTSGLGSVGISANYWVGKVSGSKIRNNALFDAGGVPTGILFPFGKGTISKSTVRVPNGNAAKLDKNIKVSSSSLVSMKGRPKQYNFLPDLSINEKNIKRSGRTYSIKVFNDDPERLQLGASGPCHLGIKIGRYVKTVKVKALAYGQSTKVKVTIPKKYISRNYIKTVKVDYYNKIKEENKKNNVVRFR